MFGGWQFNGIGRIQTGQPFRLTSGRTPLTKSNASVIPQVPPAEIQSMVKVVKDPTGYVTFFDHALIGADGRAIRNT